MMEVLVAMLVIGTGALALVMLQMHALRSSAESAQHASATLLAQELAELRASSRPASFTSSTPGANDPYLFSFTAGRAPPARADCDLAACSPAAFANAARASPAEHLETGLASKSARHGDSGSGRDTGRDRGWGMVISGFSWMPAMFPPRPRPGACGA